MKRVIAIEDIASQYPGYQSPKEGGKGSMVRDIQSLNPKEALVFDPCPGPHVQRYINEWFCSFQSRLHGAAKTAHRQIFTRHTANIAEGECALVVTLRGVRP